MKPDENWSRRFIRDQQQHQKNCSNIFVPGERFYKHSLQYIAVIDSLFLEKVFISFNPIMAVLIKLFIFSSSPQTYLAFVQDHDSATVHHCVETMGYD